MDNPQEVVADSRHNSTYIVDLMPVLRSMVQIPENYEKLHGSCCLLFRRDFKEWILWLTLTEMFQLRLEKEKVVDAVLSLSLNRLIPRYQKIFKLNCEMMKIRTGS